MIAESKRLEDGLPEIIAACRANDVKRLDLFGSRARSDFNAHSDADFLVEFIDLQKPGLFDRYFALRDVLIHALGCDIDLVELSSVQNPILRKRIESDRKLVYAA